MPAYQQFNFSTVGLSVNAWLRYCGSAIFFRPVFSGMGQNTTAIFSEMIGPKCIKFGYGYRTWANHRRLL